MCSVGDFNACVGGLQPGDDVTLVGRWRSGLRNACGRTLVSWVLENGFRILSRQSDMEDLAESWTCCRYFDGRPHRRHANSDQSSLDG